jgi:hypothetical protein
VNWEEPVEKMKSEMRQCGVCACWMKKGYELPSGNRNPRTGETPWDNFVCHRCYVEAGRNWYVTRQIALMQRRKPAAPQIPKAA